MAQSPPRPAGLSAKSALAGLPTAVVDEIERLLPPDGTDAYMPWHALSAEAVQALGGSVHRFKERWRQALRIRAGDRRALMNDIRAAAATERAVTEAAVAPDVRDAPDVRAATVTRAAPVARDPGSTPGRAGDADRDSVAARRMRWTRTRTANGS